MTSHFPVQTLSQANSNYQDPRNLEQGLLLACWTDVGPCNWAPPPLGPGLLCKLGFPGGSVGKKYACNAGEPFDSWVRKIHWRRDRSHTPIFLGFPYGSAGKESACNAGGPEFDPWVRKIPWTRERLPTPVFWPREFYGLCSPWGHKE